MCKYIVWFIFQGMPPEWSRILSMSGISKIEQQQNPTVVLNVLNLLTYKDLGLQKYMTPVYSQNVGKCCCCLISLSFSSFIGIFIYFELFILSNMKLLCHYLHGIERDDK